MITRRLGKISKLTIGIVVFVLIGIFVIPIIVVIIVLCWSSFFRVIKLKNILNEIDGKMSEFQDKGNVYTTYSLDGKRAIQVSLSDKFKKLSNNTKYTNLGKNNGKNTNIWLSVDGETIIGSIYINQDLDKTNDFNDMYKGNDSQINKIVYNNKKYTVQTLTASQALLTNSFPLAVMSPIDSEYYYQL